MGALTQAALVLLALVFVLTMLAVFILSRYAAPRKDTHTEGGPVFYTDDEPSLPTIGKER